MSQEHSVEIGGIAIHNLSFAEALERIIALAQQHQAHYIVTPNTDHMVRLQQDEDFLKVYQGASLVVADGMPLIWASKLLKNPLKERVTGADLLPALCAQAAQRGLSVYFLGAAPGVAQQAADKLQAQHPQLKVAGLYSPPFGFEREPEECQKIVDYLNQCEPDIVFVGLGSPKQEFWIAHYQAVLKVGVLLGIGAAIAFAAGVEKRAPRVMQKLGLEWLHRLTQDPKRLSQRY
ncbi:MAG: WecB/TagA/CpsF family glycosyltransferase, partial [Pseudomonadota bacterium]|nr:WecB/TagA/CpsF family glycosyltransferase [Pseudomonadota bacterium]